MKIRFESHPITAAEVAEIAGIVEELGLKIDPQCEVVTPRRFSLRRLRIINRLNPRRRRNNENPRGASVLCRRNPPKG